MLRRFQDAGHRPIALAGGATGMVGDPSGRSEERNLLDAETLDANVAAIKAQMARILDFEEGGACSSTTATGLADVTLLDFLRDVGKHFTVNQMLAGIGARRGSASEQGISSTEFSYMLLQAHDYLWLTEHLGVELQIGGSDQWGNILSGIDLVRRVRGDAVHGLSWPLSPRPTGEARQDGRGPIWLDPDQTSPYRLLPALDAGRRPAAGEFLAKFTLLIGRGRRAGGPRLKHRSVGEARAGWRGRSPRSCTGRAAARAAEQALRAFGGHLAAVAMPWRSWRGGPDRPLGSDEELSAGLDLLPLLVDAGAGQLPQRRASVPGTGAVSVNGGPRVQAGHLIGKGDVLHGRYVVLRKGQKSYAVLVRDGG